MVILPCNLGSLAIELEVRERDSIDAAGIGYCDYLGTRS